MIYLIIETVFFIELSLSSRNADRRYCRGYFLKRNVNYEEIGIL